jgi:hypothetical protein
MKKSVLIIGIIIFLPFGLFAQNENSETGMEEEENHFHYNHIALFIGASSSLETDKISFTLGTDYIRRFSFNNNFALGIYTEAIFAHHTEWLLGAVIMFTLPENVWFRSGPGIEFFQEEIGHTSETESKTEFLWRIGVGYKIHIGILIVDPSVDLDLFRSSETLVWGVNFGMGF